MQTNNAVNTAIAAFLVAVQLGLIVGIPKLIIFLIKKEEGGKDKEERIGDVLRLAAIHGDMGERPASDRPG